MRRPAGRAGRGAIREGVSYAVHTPAVLFVLATLAVVGTFGFNWPVAAPLIARDVLHLQAVGFGALMGAFGAGALAAALGLAALPRGGDRRIITAAGSLAVVLLLLLGLSRSYPLSLALMGLAGATGIVFTTTANARLQLLTPDRLRGRIMSLFVLLMAGTTPLGSYLLGHVAAAAGVPTTMVGFGAATAAGLAATVAYRTRVVRRHRPDEDGPPPPPLSPPTEA